MAKTKTKETPVLVNEKTEDQLKDETFVKEYQELCAKHDRCIASGVKFNKQNFESFITAFFTADLQVVKPPKNEGVK